MHLREPRPTGARSGGPPGTEASGHDPTGRHRSDRVTVPGRCAGNTSVRRTGLGESGDVLYDPAPSKPPDAGCPGPSTGADRRRRSRRRGAGHRMPHDDDALGRRVLPARRSESKRPAGRRHRRRRRRPNVGRLPQRGPGRAGRRARRLGHGDRARRVGRQRRSHRAADERAAGGPVLGGQAGDRLDRELHQVHLRAGHRRGRSGDSTGSRPDGPGHR